MTNGRHGGSASENGGLQPPSNSDQLRIGITCYPSVGGSGIIASTLGTHLARRGHQVHFISYERPFRLPTDVDNIFFHPVIINDYNLFKYPDYTLPLSVKMAEVSCAHNLNALHVHYAVPHATAALLAHCMLPPEKQPRIITTLHGTDTTLLGRDPGYGPAIRYALMHSDAVTAVSTFLKTETQSVLDFRCGIDVIHNFYDPVSPSLSRDAVRTSLGIADNEVMILHSSNLRPIKRIDLLLQSVSRIQPRESFKLVILAGGDFQPYSNMVDSLGLQERVIVRENVLDIENYLNAADISLYTSETESFCLSILEAMAYGCPGVAPQVGGIPEVVEDGANGLLVPFGDPDATARAVEKLIADPALRSALGANAKLHAREQFAADVIVPQYESLYRSRCLSHAPTGCI